MKTQHHFILRITCLGPNFLPKLVKEDPDLPGSPRYRFLTRSGKLCPTLEVPCGHLKWWFASLLFQCLACLLRAQRNFRRRMCCGWGTRPGGPRAAGTVLPFSAAASSPCGATGWSLSSLGLLCGSWTMMVKREGEGTGQRRGSSLRPKGLHDLP